MHGFAVQDAGLLPVRDNDRQDSLHVVPVDGVPVDGVLVDDVPAEVSGLVFSLMYVGFL